MLTAERLRELLHYDPETGVFTRRVWTNWKSPAGSIAGSARPDGYRIICVDGQPHYSHRLAVLYMTGAWPTGDVDHKNVTPGDDRWDNLRVATRSQNLANAKRSRANTSGFKGVHWFRRDKKWCAHIRVRGRRKNLGYFDTAEAAHARYCEAAVAGHGEFARSGS